MATEDASSCTLMLCFKTHLLSPPKQMEDQICQMDCTDFSALRSRSNLNLSGHPDMKVFLVIKSWKVIFPLLREPEGKARLMLLPSPRASLVHMLRLNSRTCQGLHDGFTPQLGKHKRTPGLCSSLLEKKKAFIMHQELPTAHF